VVDRGLVHSRASALDDGSVSHSVWRWQRIVSPHMAGLAAVLVRTGRDITYVLEREMVCGPSHAGLAGIGSRRRALGLWPDPGRRAQSSARRAGGQRLYKAAQDEVRGFRMGARMKSRLRLCIFQEQVRPYRADFFRHLQHATGWEITVLHGPWQPSPPGKGLPYQQVAARGRFGTLRAYERLLRHGAVVEADLLVLPFDLRILNIYEALVSSPSRGALRIALWGHGHGHSRLARPLRNALASRADALIFYSEKRKQAFGAAGVAHERRFVAPNSLVVPNHGIDNRKKSHFLYVGRIQQRKRLDLAIDALAALHVNGFPVSLVIIGDGEPELSERKAQVACLGLEGAVQFRPGTHDPAELRDAFHGAFAYLSPGHVGLGAVHAVSYGIPVVTARGMPHAPEIDHLGEGESLFTCALSTEEIAATMLTLMRRDQHAMAEACYRCYCENCSIDMMTKGFVEACQHAVSRTVPALGRSPSSWEV